VEPIAAQSYRDFLTNALLIYHPHNYGERLRRLERPITPRDVQARDRLHPGEPRY
jgi:hypothetical protein